MRQRELLGCQVPSPVAADLLHERQIVPSFKNVLRSLYNEEIAGCGGKKAQV